MTREVYQDREFVEFSRNYIFMRVFQDTDPMGKQLGDKFRIRGFPTLIVLDPSGREVDRILGFMPVPDLMEALKEIIEGQGEGEGSIRI